MFPNRLSSVDSLSRSEELGSKAGWQWSVLLAGGLRKRGCQTDCLALPRRHRWHGVARPERRAERSQNARMQAGPDLAGPSLS